MYGVVRLREYERSLRKVSQYRNFDIEELERVIGLLRNNIPLESRHKDHALKGKYFGIRECHIKNDLLLLYEKHENKLILYLVDIGTHASVFEE